MAVLLPLIKGVSCGELIVKIFDPWITALRCMLLVSRDVALGRERSIDCSREALGKTGRAISFNSGRGQQLSLDGHTPLPVFKPAPSPAVA